MIFHLMKEKKRIRYINLFILLCLFFCACTNMAPVADEQGGTVTEDTEEIGSIKSSDDPDGNIGAGGIGKLIGNEATLLFDDETIFQDVDDGADEL